DVNDPLLAIERGDQGGQCTAVQIGAKPPVRLSTYWQNTLVGEVVGRDPAGGAARILASVAAADAQKWAAGDPGSWALESHAVVARLHAAGHEVDHCDLYAEGFDPVLTAPERRAYNTPTPDLAAVAAHIARLRAAEALVLCFPTWWYGMPAILKGWFDRVWTNGVAFTLPEGGGAIRPALRNIRKFAVVTTYGSPWWLMNLVLRAPIRAVLIGGLRRLCAPDCRWIFLALSNIDAGPPARCARLYAPGARALPRVLRSSS